MDCFANFIPLWKGFNNRITFTRATSQEKRFVISLHCLIVSPLTCSDYHFCDVERGPDDLVITFLRYRFYDCLPWGEFKRLERSASLAVVKAGWSCIILDQMTESIRRGKFKESDLDKARKRAKENREKIFSRSFPDPTNHFVKQARWYEGQCL
ncbi:uncharacterized protein BO97DRAFT_279505 [Aspergillus homomorphus CBS 101889]|uniref:Uncharacterized protein n=1 Tax=Aspergillus homomorphus (strain CBS 101889) TaxID=1450537 RepID=A0A395HIQ1_ASPHC|nr:hypothetical protein BO97DRAFT_279505 [Aspergillus homomorphus CBS 101889]RAL06788.1 hypothetical protein BO97DRAFT_279505 [Aspergillus homomorphus CBS 101889]